MTDAAFEQLKARLQPDDESHIVHREMTEQEFQEITPEQVQELIALFGSNVLISLPKREHDFFTWLKENDPAVWHDLWDDDQESPYFISLSHLPSFLPGRRGFPICDLVNNDNYYFTSNDITPDDGKILVESSLDLIAEEKQLSSEKIFMVEIWRAPIDQWRFAWMYNMKLDDVKEMVRWLITEGLLEVPQQRKEETDGPQIEVSSEERKEVSTIFNELFYPDDENEGEEEDRELDEE